MAFLDSLIFPETLSYGVVGGPEYFTTLVEGDSGTEQRRSAWPYPRHRYQFNLAPRQQADTEALYAFFHLASGRAKSFRFRDPHAGESTGYHEPLGVGTGSPEAYQLIKRYTSGALTFDRVITKPIAGTVTLRVDGSPFTDFAVDVTTGMVFLAAPLDDVIDATFDFHVPVRFESDRLQIRAIDGAWVWGSVGLVEVRPETPPELYIATWEVDAEADLELVYDTEFAH